MWHKLLLFREMLSNFGDGMLSPCKKYMLHLSRVRYFKPAWGRMEAEGLRILFPIMSEPFQVRHNTLLTGGADCFQSYS